MTRIKRQHRMPLPSALHPLFWDCDFRQIRWEADCDFIVGRVLAVGDWPNVRWVYRRLGADRLKQWLARHHGAGLSPRQLRFWETVLRLPHRQVTTWLSRPARQVWDRRCHEPAAVAGKKEV